MTTAASSNFRFLVLRTFFFSKIGLHPALFCILKFSKLLVCGVEAHPTWRWGLFCQQLLSSELLAEALPGFLALSRAVLWSWGSVKSWVLQVTLGSLMAFEIYEILFSDFENGAAEGLRGSIPWSWSRALVLQEGGRQSVCQKHTRDLASSDQRCQHKTHFNQCIVIFW